MKSEHSSHDYHESLGGFFLCKACLAWFILIYMFPKSWLLNVWFNGPIHVFALSKPFSDFVSCVSIVFLGKKFFLQTQHNHVGFVNYHASWMLQHVCVEHDHATNNCGHAWFKHTCKRMFYMFDSLNRCSLCVVIYFGWSANCN